jgi:hypothetical protein
VEATPFVISAKAVKTYNKLDLDRVFATPVDAEQAGLAHAQQWVDGHQGRYPHP